MASLVLAVITLSCVVFIYEKQKTDQLTKLAECEKYEAYINEKLLLSVDVTPKEYKNGADYYVRLSYQDDEYTIPMTYNDGALYSETEIMYYLENANVYFGVTYKGQTAEKMLFKIKSISISNVFIEDYTGK